MVNVSGGTLFSKRKRHKLCKGIKLRTMASVSMGIAVLALFRSETIYFHATQRYLEESKKIRPMYSSPTRFGFVPRKLLRTSVLHEMDTLKDEMDALKNKGRDFTRSSSVSYVSYPRVISLDKSIEFSELSPRKTYRQVPSLGQPNEDEESDEPINDFERPFLEQCEPRVDPSFYPTCNGLHEVAMDFDISLLSTKGSWRTVWKVEHHKAAIKILHLTRQFDQQSFEQHRLDATIMEHLTASPHVVDAYGYCGQSVVTEMAPTGGRDYVKQNEIRSQERLKIARDLARGLADIHALQHLPDYNGKHSPVPKFAHNDINIANTVQVDGRIKWNDFNIGVLLRAHTKNSTLACGSPVRFKADLWRSPEEIRNTSYVHLEQSDMVSYQPID